MNAGHLVAGRRWCVGVRVTTTVVDENGRGGGATDKFVNLVCMQHG